MYQVDLEQLRLVRQGELDNALIEEVEATARGCGVDGISRHACHGVLGQRQLVENPIVVGTRGQSAIRTGVKPHPAIATQQGRMLHDRRRN